MKRISGVEPACVAQENATEQSRQRVTPKCGCFHRLVGATAGFLSGRCDGLWPNDWQGIASTFLRTSDRVRRPQLST